MRKVKRFFRRIGYFFMRIWVWLKTKLRKKSMRVYKVTASNVPSMLGGHFISYPKLGKEIVVLTKKRTYLTLMPLNIKKFKKTGRFTIYGKYSRITAKRIK